MIDAKRNRFAALDDDLDAANANADYAAALDAVDIAPPMDADEPEAPAGNAPVAIIPAVEFVAANPEPPPALIDGVLRCGGVAGIVSGSKCKKSHALLHLALCIASGTQWHGHAVKGGEVLIVDIETQPGDCSQRLQRISNAMGVTLAGLDILPLRGTPINIHDLAIRLCKIPRDTYISIVVDPLYKLTPSGADENSAADVGMIMARLDQIATVTGAAVLVVHHQPKGDMSQRQTIDLGAGSGAFARSVDALIALRPHEEDGAAVLEIIPRSFSEPEPIGLRWEYPLWQKDPFLDVTKLRSGRGQSSDTPDAAEFARRFIPDGQVIWQANLFRRAEQSGIGAKTARKLLDEAVDTGSIRRVKSKKDRRKIGYRLGVKP